MKLTDQNENDYPKPGKPGKRKRQQLIFAAGLLILWLLVFLADHLKLIK